MAPTPERNAARKRQRQQEHHQYEHADQHEHQRMDHASHAAAPTAHSPVRSKNPYLHFARAKRPEVAAQHPDWTVQQTSAELGRLWKALGEAQRRPWVELAQFDKARFGRELALLAQQQQLQQQPLAGSASSAAVGAVTCRAPSKPIRLPYQRRKTSAEPRQPDTAYICFWKRARPEVVAAYPNMAAVTVSKEVGRRWKTLSDEERKIWQDLAADDRLRYEREMTAFRRQGPKDANVSTLPPPLKDPFAPKPAKTGFQFFLDHNRESLTLLNMTLNEFRVEMSHLWKRMSKDDKKVWLQMEAQDHKRYDDEMAGYKTPAYMAMDGLRAKQRLEEFKRIAKSNSNAPELPHTAYSFYMAVKRRELQLERTDLRHNEVNREVGKAWKLLDSYEKLPFIGKAQRDVDRFIQEMERFVNSENSNAEEPRGLPSCSEASTPMKTAPTSAPRPKKRARPSPPKKPLNAYNMMYLAKRDSLMVTYQLSHNECSALCGKMWRQMAEDEREEFYRLAAQDKARYERELRQFEQASRRGSKTAVTSKSVTSPRPPPAPTSWESMGDESLVELSAFEQLRRLEESAREVFGSHDGRSQMHSDDQGVYLSPGFRYYVESKRGDREQWTGGMWVEDWESLAEPHRALWEELAADNAGLGTHDSLCGLVGGEGASPIGYRWQ